MSNKISESESESTISQRFCHLDKMIDNPQDIANTFNTYFINIGPFIAEQIHSGGSYKTYLKASHSSTLTLTNIDEGYVALLIDCLINKESSGNDKLSNKHYQSCKKCNSKTFNPNE